MHSSGTPATHRFLATQQMPLCGMVDVSIRFPLKEELCHKVAVAIFLSPNYFTTLVGQ
jgi:hypothetical protein